jgi:hypothetical protein
MKKVILFISVFAFLTACQNSIQKVSSTPDSTAQEIQSLGGNKDKHGCLTAAGQTWSQIKNDCIQVFSVGIRLNPIKIDSTEAIISAFVVPNVDSTSYELFLAGALETIILDQQNSSTFSKDQFIYNSATGGLFINKLLAYKTE